ncbi:hypothetical protein T4C_13171 [Trichinella pseudospiralis]|uniref:Uncharacterized protein n=1 Tax=Trichinella pseudospiralis TaxID=6337 RepID=A0A0V1K9F9_TRIPS|nr:hypothetical protein T4C_13171 [Trichinella pseudospiralis]
MAMQIFLLNRALYPKHYYLNVSWLLQILATPSFTIIKAGRSFSALLAHMLRRSVNLLAYKKEVKWRAGLFIWLSNIKLCDVAQHTRQLVDIRRTHTYYSSLRRSSLSLLKDLSCSSPLHYIEGVYRRGVPEWVPTGRVLRVGHQKPPTFLTGGGFVLGGRRGFIAAALRLPQPDLQ